MNKLLIPNIDLDITLLGWQSFAWDKIGEWYYWFTQNSLIKLKIVDFENEFKILLWQTFDENWNETNDEEYIKKYFRLDLDFDEIVKKISKDKFVKNAIKANPWLRILSQDFEQCLLSFILSANNSIPNIRKSIRLMNKVLGKKVVIDWMDFYLFPKTEVIASQNEARLREFKMGFRTKYILNTANKILSEDAINEFKINKITNECISNEDFTRAALTYLPWVWDKIADCIMCFSLWFDNITPIDTWAKKALNKFYWLDSKMKIQEIRKWLNNYFRWYANFAWHFLFEYVRNNSKVLDDAK